MINTAYLESNLLLGRNYLDWVKARLKEDLSDPDEDTEDLLIYRFQRVICSAVQSAHHIAEEELCRKAPEETPFDPLRQEGKLDSDLVEKLNRMAQFRKVYVIDESDALDPAELFEKLPVLTTALTTFFDWMATKYGL